MDYAFEYQGKVFTPQGKSTVIDVAGYNTELEQQELAWLRTAPDKLFLCV